MNFSEIVPQIYVNERRLCYISQKLINDVKGTESMLLDELKNAVSGSAAAFRSRTKLQPVGGEGDKVFPPTFDGGVYAYETWRHQGKEIRCVLLDSVASQANRAEEALLAAIRAGKLALPIIEVDYSEANPQFRKPIPNLTSLEVPHRLADAILRDSELSDGTRFSKSAFAAEWSKANLWNSTPIYRLCPTALLFGMWGNPEKPGGLGAKFERAYVSEIVGVNISEMDKRRGFRLDPTGASSHVGVVPGLEGSFTVAKGKEKGMLKPSEINHSNIGHGGPGGVRFEYAEQSTVVSIGALRKLQFPVEGKRDAEIDIAGRTVLASLGLCAGVLAAEMGTSLRSRCHLWPTEARKWELLDRPGESPREFSLTGEQAIELAKAAIHEAERLGLRWETETIRLKPTREYVELIQQSQEVMATKSGDGE